MTVPATMGGTYYERLGVTSDATVETIEQAYRERLKETHPDVSDHQDAGEHTRALIEAREVLTDEHERRRYDRLGHDRYVRFHDSFVEPTAEDVAATDPENSSAPGEATDSAATANGPTGGASSEADPAGTWSSGRGGGDESRSRRTGRTSPNGRTSRSQRHAQNEQTRAPWNDAGPGRDGRTTGDAGPATESRGYHAWETGGSQWIYPTDESGSTVSVVSSGSSLVLLLAAFALYPVMLWAAITPSFPPAVNIVVGVCILLLVAYLQSIPGIAIVVFGAWTALLPVALVVGLDVPLLSTTWIVAFGGTALPLGLSVLTWTVVGR